MRRFIWKTGGAELPLHVDAADIPSVEELGHALSLINRWTGWARWPYSVAQHAVLVSYLVEPRYALPALHHDDHECVTGDISSPLKRELRSRSEENRLRELAARFDFLNPHYLYGKLFGYSPIRPAEEAIARADLLATYFEAQLVVGVPPSKVDEHFGPMKSTPDEKKRLSSVASRVGLGGSFDGLALLLQENNSWLAARDAYISRHKELLFNG